MGSLPQTCQATVLAGVPSTNLSLYHRVRFNMGDPAAVIEFHSGAQASQKLFMCRDIEMKRARESAKAYRVVCPEDFAPQGSLDPDRPTATAQALAECLSQAGVEVCRSDRTLPLIYAEHIRQRGIQIIYDPELGVEDRRSKDPQELELLRKAQKITERAIELACRTIARAQADSQGMLVHEDEPLTSERVRAMVDIFLLKQGYTSPGCIVAGGVQGADCHNRGTGVLKTGEPVVVDIFPCDQISRYNGDCTRTVVHGQVHDEFARMHDTVVKAKKAAIDMTRAGVTAEAAYLACMKEIKTQGWTRGLPDETTGPDYCSMQHGLGHAVGLEVHEPPLLDMGGPALVAGEVLTYEPGLYHQQLGGVRIEDMIAVTETGIENFNTLHEGLDWL